MNWDDVGDAIQAAITRASGLDASKVIWKNQNRNAPGLDYVTIRLGGPITLGIDYIHTSQNLTRAAGQEIKMEVRGQREVPLEIECFTQHHISGESGAALELCSRILASLLLPSVRAILTKQNISPFDPGPPNWIADIPSTAFRGRAVATVRCYMPAPTVAEYVGYISRVSGTVTVQGGNGPDQVLPFDTSDSDV